MLRDIRVIAIDQRLESKAGEAVPAHTATFEVSAKQTEVILLASEIGKVTLIRAYDQHDNLLGSAAIP